MNGLMEQLLVALEHSRWMVYGAAFVLVVIESAGVPLPALSFVMLAAGLAGSGDLSIWPLAIATIAGGVIGGGIGYSFGSRQGLAFLDRLGPLLRLSPRARQQAEISFQREGKTTVLLGRYMPFFCFAAAVLSGATRMDRREFERYNLAGIVLWTGPSVGLAFYFGRSLSTAQNYVGVGLLLLTLSISYLFIVRRIRKGRNEQL